MLTQGSIVGFKISGVSGNKLQNFRIDCCIVLAQDLAHFIDRFRADVHLIVTVLLYRLSRKYKNLFPTEIKLKNLKKSINSHKLVQAQLLLQFLTCELQSMKNAARVFRIRLRVTFLIAFVTI